LVLNKQRHCFFKTSVEGKNSLRPDPVEFGGPVVAGVGGDQDGTTGVGVRTPATLSTALLRHYPI
jgi:hypothetical protein